MNSKEQKTIPQNYGNWKFIQQGSNSQSLEYECQCKNHTRQIFRKDKIMSGEAAKECKYCREAKRSLVGKTFGFLKVLEKDQNKSTSQRTYYICECTRCGTLKSIRSDKLNGSSGLTVSCGCWNKDGNTNNLLNQTIGNWKIIEQVPPPEWETRSGAWWKLKCLKCGEEKILKGIHITLERVGKCQYDTNSMGENLITEILYKNHIKFSTEQTFTSCYNTKTGALYRFDFFITNDEQPYLIEYNGKQHYHPVDFFKTSLQEQRRKDREKIQWAHQNNIPLIAIPYTQYNNLTIDDLKLETSKFIVMGDSYE